LGVVLTHLAPALNNSHPHPNYNNNNHPFLLPPHANTQQISNHEMSVHGQRRCSIIFFLHIPFPTSQIFRALYCGDELLNVRGGGGGG
jgi:hypothetical protein